LLAGEVVYGDTEVDGTDLQGQQSHIFSVLHILGKLEVLISKGSSTTMFSLFALIITNLPKLVILIVI